MLQPNGDGPTLDTSRPFTFKQAQESGLTRRELRGDAYVRVSYGRYVAAGTAIDLRLRAQTIVSGLTDDAHLSHHSAAELLGLWLDPAPVVHICRGGTTRVKRADVAAHQCTRHGERRADGDIWTRHGLAVSAPITCFFELADTLDLVDLVVLGDSLVKKGHTTPDELAQRSEAFAGDGAIRARRAARLVRAGVDSRQETRLRLLLVMAGLPEPTVNVCLRDADGEVMRRLDLAYERWKVAVEYDGRHHAENSAQWRSDIRRREELEALSWRMIIIESSGIFTDPADTADRAEAALRQAGWRGPREPWPDFRRHFPGYL